MQAMGWLVVNSLSSILCICDVMPFVQQTLALRWLDTNFNHWRLASLAIFRADRVISQPRQIEKLISFLSLAAVLPLLTYFGVTLVSLLSPESFISEAVTVTTKSSVFLDRTYVSFFIMSSSNKKDDHHCCLVCNATETADGGALLLCSRCKCSYFCSKDHQRLDWKHHKKWCYPIETKTSSPNWWEKKRKCPTCNTTHAINRSCHFDNCPQDPDYHEGVPELIIWPGNESPHYSTGWGNVEESHSAALKKRFEEELGCDEEKLYKIRPEAFRWTCCGKTLDTPYPCDHHGTGSTPCSCDFCTGGKPIPQRMRKSTVGNYGLKLSNGPDPRSYNPILGSFNLMMNKLMVGDYSGN